MRKRSLFTVLGLMLAWILAWSPLPGTAGAEGQSGWYENEWNFVSDSMDISQGIPKDAIGVLGKIQRTGVLRVAVDPRNAAPQVFLDTSRPAEDQLAGADIQLARMIAERMGAELRLIRLDSSQLLSALTEDQCDLALSALVYTPGRALSNTLSKGYYFPKDGDTVGILIREGDEIASPEDLAGKVIIAQSNSLAETIAVRLIPDYLEFRRASSIQGVYESMVRGKADAGIVNISTAERYIRKNPRRGLKLVEGLRFSPDESYLGYRVAAKKGETQLIAFVNGVIDEATRTGQYEAWVEEAARRVSELGF